MPQDCTWSAGCPTLIWWEMLWRWIPPFTIKPSFMDQWLIKHDQLYERNWWHSSFCHGFFLLCSGFATGTFDKNDVEGAWVTWNGAHTPSMRGMIWASIARHYTLVNCKSYCIWDTPNCQSRGIFVILWPYLWGGSFLVSRCICSV